MYFPLFSYGKRGDKSHHPWSWNFQELKELPDLRRTSLCKQPGAPWPRPTGCDFNSCKAPGLALGPPKRWCTTSKYFVENIWCYTPEVTKPEQWEVSDNDKNSTVLDCLILISLSRATDCIHRLRQLKFQFTNSNNRIWFGWKLGLFNAIPWNSHLFPVEPWAGKRRCTNELKAIRYGTYEWSYNL